MTKLSTTIAATAFLALTSMAQAQQAPDPSKPDPAAATSTGTSTSQAEMNRGVPGVNVDVGSKASNGVISADVDRNTNARNLSDRNRTDATSSDGTRAARADRN